ncbi:MAG TPA: phosphoribosylamine--glycine ligase [Nitrososphaeraceae archaeon]
MVKNNVLIIGSGGREHALGWKLLQSDLVRKVYFAPGNGGTFQNVNIQPTEMRKLTEFAKKNECFTIVGPETPLANGIVDYFVKERLRIFGPSRQAALLESSKEFAKQFMNKNGIPTPVYRAFSDPEEAKDYAVKQKTGLVIKADGLASGKGVVVCNNSDEAIDAIDQLMVKREFGIAANRIIIEERLSGEECSFIVLCDSRKIIPLASSQDHKRVFNDDKGPNTGGMGSYSPTPVVDENLYNKIIKEIMEPAVKGMVYHGTPFKGFLYAGIMIEQLTKQPYVLEFNVRMGDPECQSIMMRMKSDLFRYLQSAINEELDSMRPIEWKNKFAVCVVMASRGYPLKYSQGHFIEGLESDFGPEVMVFHSGTRRCLKNRVKTDGGRVLGVTALGDTIRMAIKAAYFVVHRISWGENDYYYRTDIAMKYSTAEKPASFFL